MQLYTDKPEYFKLFEAIASPVVVMDKGGTMAFCNKAAADFFGINSHEQLTRRFTDLISKQNEREQIAHLLESNDAIKGFSGSLTVLSALQKQVVIELDILPLKNNELDKTWLVASFTKPGTTSQNHDDVENRYQYDQAISEVSGLLLSGQGQNPVQVSLLKLLEATRVCHAFMLENFLDENDRLCCRKIIEVRSSCKSCEKENTIPEYVVYTEIFPGWADDLSSGRILHGLVKHLPDPQKQLLSSSGIKSILMIPVFVQNQWQSVIGFADTLYERLWTDDDIRMLKTGIGFIGIYLSKARTNEELIESHRQYKSLYQMIRLMCDNVPDMIWAKDLEKRFTFVNKAICENLLLSPDTNEPINKNVLYFVERARKSHPENPGWHTFGENCGDSDNSVMESMKAQRFDEYGNVMGKFLFLDVYKAPFLDENGNMIGTVGCARDITHQKWLGSENERVEEQLRDKSARIDALIRSIPDLMFIMDENGTFVDFFADKNEKLLLPPDQVIGSSVFDIFPEEEARNHLNYFRECLQTGLNQSFNYEIEQHQFTTYFEARVAKMDEKHVLSIVRDITVKRQLEIELSYLSQLQRLMMNLATRFINIPFHQTDRELYRALDEIGRFLKVDRVYIYDFNNETHTMDGTHEWCAEGISPEIESISSVPYSLLPDWVNEHKNGKSIYIKSVKNLDTSNPLRKILEPQMVQSMISIPLIHLNNCLGSVGFDSVKTEREWNETELSLLKLFAQLLTNVKVKSNIEKTLTQSEEKFRNLAELSPFAIMIYQDDYWVYTNKEGEEISEYSAEEMYKLHYWDFVAPEYVSLIKERGKTRLEGKEVPTGYEFKIITKSGREKWVYLTGSLIDYMGKPAGLISVNDITDRKKAAIELKKSESRYRQLVEEINDVLFELDMEGVVKYMSPVVEEITGYPADFYTHKHFSELIVNEDVHQLEKAFADLHIGKDYTSEYRILTKNNSTCWVRSSSKAIVEDGRIIGFRGLAQNITNQKMSELELRVALEKAQESDRLKTAFMNNISHEVRTPLNGILGFSRLLIEPETNEDLKKEYLNRLESSSNRLINTITDYIDISLIASGNIATYYESINIKNLFTNLYDFYQHECQLKNLRFVLSSPAQQTDAYVFTDPDLLNKILTQLIANAIKFTDSGSIIIGYTLQDHQPEFFVKDTGIGISDDFRESVFDPFRQEETAISRQYEGNGLGLSIAKGLVELLGGKIWFESTKGKGSEFYFSIPMRQGEKPDIHFIEKTSNINNAYKPVILVAEDDITNFVYIKSTLSHLKPREIIHVVNGQEAVDICRSRTDLNLVIMDIKMPVLDGLEATRQIRTFNKTLPIVAMTAYALNNDKIRCLEAGCNGFITKPFQKEQIILVLANQLK